MIERVVVKSVSLESDLKEGEEDIIRFDEDFSNNWLVKTVGRFEIFVVVAYNAYFLLVFFLRVIYWFVELIGIDASYGSRLAIVVKEPRLKTSHTIAGYSVLSFRHLEIEFHVPLASAQKFAEWLPLTSCQAQLVTTLRFTGTSHEDAYVSFNFDSFRPSQFTQMREFFQKLVVPTDWGVGMHPGKGLFVNLDLITASLPDDRLRRKYDPNRILDVFGSLS
jgi:hypothetical protein